MESDQIGTIFCVLSELNQYQSEVNCGKMHIVMPIAGFRKGRGTRNQIANIHCIM